MRHAALARQVQFATVRLQQSCSVRSRCRAIGQGTRQGSTEHAPALRVPLIVVAHVQVRDALDGEPQTQLQHEQQRPAGGDAHSGQRDDAVAPILPLVALRRAFIRDVSARCAGEVKGWTTLIELEGPRMQDYAVRLIRWCCMINPYGT